MDIILHPTALDPRARCEYGPNTFIHWQPEYILCLRLLAFHSDWCDHWHMYEAHLFLFTYGCNTFRFFKRCEPLPLPPLVSHWHKRSAENVVAPFGAGGITCSVGDKIFNDLQSCRIALGPVFSSPVLLWTHSNPQYQEDRYRLTILLFLKICRQPLRVGVLNYHHCDDSPRRWPYLQDLVYNRPLTTTLLLHPYYFLNLSFIDLLVLLIEKVYLHLRIGRITVWAIILTTRMIWGFHIPALLWLLSARHIIQKTIIMA